MIGNRNDVTAQSVKTKQTVMVNSRVFLTTGGQATMPDMTDWSQAQVNKFGQLTGLDITNSGSGFVKKQSIKSGEKN